jgi:hypothetical protein
MTELRGVHSKYFHVKHVRTLAIALQNAQARLYEVMLDMISYSTLASTNDHPPEPHVVTSALPSLSEQ